MATELENELSRNVTGDVLFDAYSRGRYATDASIYQMMPAGVVIPKTLDDVKSVLAIARERELTVLPRGAGTSQCGQTVNNSLVLDNTRYLNRIIDIDVVNRRAIVEPGIVLDELNRALKPHGLWCPVDVSTASRATIGGMTANNSCGGRSIKYGMMRDNVISIDALLADGSEATFGGIAQQDSGTIGNSGAGQLSDRLLAVGARYENQIQERFPALVRRVGGYNIDALKPSTNNHYDLSSVLVGSEGTLAYFSQIELKLSPLLVNRVIGVCHFPDFSSAMDSAQHLVKLGPAAVELVDDTMIALARKIPMFESALGEFVKGDPAALLLVEFAEESDSANLRKLDELEGVMSDLGFSWQSGSQHRGGVLRAIEPELQNRISEVRKSGLNIMMSMKSEGKPVSFIEDCAVELSDLAAYTNGINDIFAKYQTKGTWYAHASVGCLHVRPVLNLKLDADLKSMRAIAEETFELVRHYKGSHSGEHGDGIVRSEFHRTMFGDQIVEAFGEVKQILDPECLFNPGKIVDPPKMDDRSLLRFHQDYKVPQFDTALDWSEWTGQGGGFQGAIEMCNNNGACRKLQGGVMCPSFRVTRDERDLTRGRANVLRLAISGQLGSDALASDEMADSVRLCVSCKGCKRECPTGVDMAKMKIEILHARTKRCGITLHDRLVAWLPVYAPMASRFASLMNARNSLPFLARLLQKPTGFTSKRKLPIWTKSPFADTEVNGLPNTDSAKTVALFVDTFSRYFEPENMRAAIRVLTAAGYHTEVVKSVGKRKKLCCGRTFLSAGLVDQAKEEAAHLIQALLPYAKKGIPVVGLEPGCLLGLRDEIPAMLPGADSAMVAKNTFLFEEFLTDKADLELLTPKLKPLGSGVLLHGHCHQKAFNVMSSVQRSVTLIPEVSMKTIETSCCGMAGAFGYATDTAEISLAMGELSLFPAVREADDSDYIVADGTSCRHQIKDGTDRMPIHVARLLDISLGNL